jgi:hypothetical protein
MPLLPIFRTSPEQIHLLRIHQIIALCGDSKLRNNSDCSKELREYLSQAASEKIFEYMETCLQSSFENSGFVLQDLVNELGRRLDYSVDNGFYQGRPNATGYDGIWNTPDGHALVVEVKTSDAYRINLNTIAKYRDDLIVGEKIPRKSSILIVVGREDTGDLEAQVRGSKHAWDIRLLSIDALIKLVSLKESTEEETVTKIHELLVPFEYTKLDRIIDVALTAAKDAGAVIQQEVLPATGDSDDDSTGAETEKQEKTPQEVMAAMRQMILAAVGKRERMPLIKKSTALYWSSDRNLRIVCSISKHYSRGAYWYGYHQQWDKFLSEGAKGFFVLGCIGRNEAYALPFDWIHSRLGELHTTERDVTKYWHVHLEETPTGDLVMPTFTEGHRISVVPFRISLA